MIRRLPVYFILMVLAGCGSSPPAPVVELRTPAAAAPQAAAAAKPAEPAKPGFYVVKKGDTLYSIALEHGQTYRDVAAWNNLTDPTKIQVGQQLRVVPPEPVAETRPIVSTGGPIVVGSESPAVATPAPAAAAAIAGNLKREPKAVRLPYSDQAWAQMQKADQAPPPAAGEAPAVKPSEPAPAQEGDSLDWSWPSNGKVIAPFAEGTNKGVDLSGRNGDPVLAAAAGKVVYVGTGIRGYGKMVIVKHNAAFLSVYAHNSQILVKEDQMVTRGQKIAEIGSSDADQPMLHFEIRHLNKPVDPLKYLPGRP
jgi:lipoprotein NlpD